MEGKKGKKKRFDRDFKMSAVKMISEGGHKASEVARGCLLYLKIQAS